MKHSKTQSLVVLNLVLVVLVAAFGLVRRAGAADPSQPTARARGVYTMVSGTIQGGSNDVVYIIDTANQELLSLAWNVSQNKLSVIGYRSLVTDAQNSRGNR